MENCLKDSVIETKKIADNILKSLSLEVSASTYQRSLLILSLNKLDRVDNKVYSNVARKIAKLLDLNVGTVRYKIYDIGYTPDDLLSEINTINPLKILKSNTVADDDIVFLNKISENYVLKENNYIKVKTMNNQTQRKSIESKSAVMNSIVKGYINELNYSSFNLKRNYQLSLLLLSIADYRLSQRVPVNKHLLSLAINEIAYELELSTNTIRDNIYGLGLTSKKFAQLFEEDFNLKKTTILDLFNEKLIKDNESDSVRINYCNKYYFEIKPSAPKRPLTIASSEVSKDLRDYLDQLNKECSIGTYHRLLFVMRLSKEKSLSNNVYLNCLSDISSYTNKAKSTISDKYTRCLNLKKNEFLDIYRKNIEDVRNLFLKFAVEDSYDKDVEAINFVFDELLK